MHRNAWSDARRRTPEVPRADASRRSTATRWRSDVEQAAFAENALQYRASLAFLDGKIRSLKYAIKEVTDVPV